MKLSISKNIPYQLLYLLCIGLPYLNNYELTFAVWAFTLVVTLNKTYSIHILKIVACFVAILGIAFISGLFRSYPLYQVIRDITYLLKPIIGILIGYQLCKFNSKTAFRTIVYTGVIIALIHLVILTITATRFQSLSVNLLRQYGGYFSDYEIYVLIILIFHTRFKLEFSKKKLHFLILILGVSSFLYLARTNIIQFAILFVGMKGYYKINRQSILVVASVAIAVLAGYAAVLSYNPKRNGKGLEAFLYKIKIAPIEPFKTKIDRDDWKDFNDNYRSFENIITVKQVTHEGVVPTVFGKGLGATINLGRRVRSNDGTFVQQIAIVHNGYMTVFMKSGLIGVVFVFLSIYYIAKTRKPENELLETCNRLLVGTGFFLIISYFVFLGFYFKFDTKAVLIGFIIAIMERERKLLNAISPQN
jgi:hypothetical protein